MAVDGTWNITFEHPAGNQDLVLVMETDGESISGSTTNPARGITVDIVEGKVEGNHVWFRSPMTQPLPIDISVDGTVDGDSFSGKVTLGGGGTFPFSGTRA